MNYRNLIFILIAVLLAGCKEEPPTASFSFSPLEPEVGEAVLFNNASTKANSYEWDFGDGATSTSESPTHSYNDEGVYTVELKAKNEDGSDTYTLSVPVAHPPPVAAFSQDKTEADIGETVTFTNQSTNAVSYSWSFGDGGTSTAENPTHDYSEAGTFTIQLTATGAGAVPETDVTTSSITIVYPPPVADFTMSKSDVLPGEIITFTNQSEWAQSYSWDFGDGSTSTVTNPTHSFASEGIYTVTLTATGLRPGTNDIHSMAVNVCTPAVADFTMDKDNVCVGEEVQFTNQSQNATSYLWDFGDGSTSASADPVHTWSSGGAFTVQLTASRSCGGSNVFSDQVSVHEENIFPGEGAMDLEFGDTWATVEGNMPADTDYLGYYVDGGGYVHHVYESESWDILIFLVSPTASYYPSSADILWLIVLREDYIGSTAECIHIGSLLSEVEAAYGIPETIGADYWYYESMGILFGYNTSDVVDQIELTPSITKKSTGIQFPDYKDYRDYIDTRNIKSQLRK